MQNNPKTKMVRPELLAPAGNFSEAELINAVAFAHQHKVKAYLACNIYSRNHEQKKIQAFLSQTGKIGPDAVIISDPGILLLAKDIIPHIPVHLSTQANTTNINTVEFWHRLGVKRVNLARELSLTEIREIAVHSPMETEVFVHGAMCISYSGRCLLSSFLSGRDSNRGLCSHPCRWKYAVVEEFRPDQYHPVLEDERGTYIFNSKDLCMIEHIPELIQAGITSLKIEGRMKGINYLASVVKTYRNAIDRYISTPETYKMNPEWLSELYRVFHREYCTGFYFGKPDETLQNYDNRHKGEIHSFVGKIIGVDAPQNYIVEIRNKISLEDSIEILSPRQNPKPFKILELTDIQHHSIVHAKPNTTALLKIEEDCQVNDIVRKI